jgi:hypothetical protein
MKKASEPTANFCLEAVGYMHMSSSLVLKLLGRIFNFDRCVLIGA